MKQKPGIALPRWLLRTTTMQMHSVDVVLVMALVLQHHGTADAVRRAAVSFATECVPSTGPR
ncbi:hypothetical protein ACM75C_08505 [Pseudomonas aeruginosa]